MMSNACAKYILSNNCLPPKVKVEKELKQDKPAQLAFVMTNYDTFHLKINSDMLEGANPYEKIKEIMGNETEKLTSYGLTEDKWKVEYAKSSRAKCRSCGMNIEKGTVRVGEPDYYENHLNYRWHHEKCIFWKGLSIELLDLNGLEKEDKKRIESNF